MIRRERCSYATQERGLLAFAGHTHPLELAVEPDIDIEIGGVLVEVNEGPRSQREVTALALVQGGKPA
jgi:hypothetical protein